MSERGSQSKNKSLDLRDYPEINNKCSKYQESGTMDVVEFLPFVKVLEKELIERDPDEVLISKVVSNAFAKAISECLVKSIRMLNVENSNTNEFLNLFVNSFASVCRNFAFLLKKANSSVKVEKNTVEHIKTLFTILHSKPSSNNFQPIYFVLLNVLYELVNAKKKKIDMKDSELVNLVFAILQEMIFKLITEKNHLSLATNLFRISGFDKKISMFCNNYQDFITTDMVHYVLIGIEMLLKYENYIVASEFTKTILPNMLVYLLDISDFNQSQLSTLTDLAIQKYLISMNILKSLCLYTSKIEIPRSFLKGNSEKIKNIFFYTILSYSKYYFMMSGCNFEKDDSILGKLYTTLYEIMSNIAINSDQEGFPFLLFSVILQNVNKT